MYYIFNKSIFSSLFFLCLMFLPMGYETLSALTPASNDGQELAYYRGNRYYSSDRYNRGGLYGDRYYRTYNRYSQPAYRYYDQPSYRYNYYDPYYYNGMYYNSSPYSGYNYYPSTGVYYQFGR